MHSEKIINKIKPKGRNEKSSQTNSATPSNQRLWHNNTENTVLYGRKNSDSKLEKKSHTQTGEKKTQEPYEKTKPLNTTLKKRFQT